MISSTQKRRILHFILFFAGILLFNFVNTFIPARTHDIISFAYMGFVVAWYLSVRERIISGTMRRLFTSGSGSV